MCVLAYACVCVGVVYKYVCVCLCVYLWMCTVWCVTYNEQGLKNVMFERLDCVCVRACSGIGCNLPVLFCCVIAYTVLEDCVLICVCLCAHKPSLSFLVAHTHIRICSHTYTLAHMLTHIHTYTHTHMLTAHTHIRVCSHTYTHIHTYAYAHAHTHIHTHTHIRICSRTYTHTRMLTHIHTHTHMQTRPVTVRRLRSLGPLCIPLGAHHVQ